MTATISTQAEWFDNYVSSTMSILGVHAPDGDGDLPVRGRTSPGWVRVETREPWGVRVFAYAATGVPARTPVLTELNAVEASDRLVRVHLTRDGIVVVEHLLLADAVGTDALRAVIARVLEVADRIGPMLATVHGGQVPLSPPTSEA